MHLVHRSPLALVWTLRAVFLVLTPWWRHWSLGIMTHTPRLWSLWSLGIFGSHFLYRAQSAALQAHSAVLQLDSPIHSNKLPSEPVGCAPGPHPWWCHWSLGIVTRHDPPGCGASGRWVPLAPVPYDRAHSAALQAHSAVLQLDILGFGYHIVGAAFPGVGSYIVQPGRLIVQPATGFSHPCLSLVCSQPLCRTTVFVYLGPPWCHCGCVSWPMRPFPRSGASVVVYLWLPREPLWLCIFGSRLATI